MQICEENTDFLPILKALELDKRKKNSNIRGKSIISDIGTETIIIIDEDGKKKEYFASSDIIQDKSQKIMLTRSRLHEST